MKISGWNSLRTTPHRAFSDAFTDRKTSEIVSQNNGKYLAECWRGRLHFRPAIFRRPSTLLSVALQYLLDLSAALHFLERL